MSGTLAPSGEPLPYRLTGYEGVEGPKVGAVFRHIDLPKRNIDMELMIKINAECHS
jgi:hypothetical protein